jgi:hypothetical protein
VALNLALIAHGSPIDNYLDSTSSSLSKKENLIILPLSVKKGLFLPIVHLYYLKIATFHPLVMNLGISRQVHIFTHWVKRKTSDWDTMLKI